MLGPHEDLTDEDGDLKRSSLLLVASCLTQNKDKMELRFEGVGIIGNEFGNWRILCERVPQPQDTTMHDPSVIEPLAPNPAAVLVTETNTTVEALLRDTIVLTVPPPLMKRLNDLTESGLFGAYVEETLLMLVKEKIRELKF